MTTFEMIGTTDDVVDCAKCGKPDLRMTVILEIIEDGISEGITYYGTTCAAKALAGRGIRITAAQVRSQAVAAQVSRDYHRKDAEQMLDFYGIPDGRDLTREEWLNALALYRENNPDFIGYRTWDECERMLTEAIPRWRRHAAA